MPLQALFRLPPTEPDVRLSPHPAPQPEPTFQVQPLRLSRAFLFPWFQPVPLRQVLAYGFTSADYYGDSVALNLTACRPSRFYARKTFSPCRRPFVPFPVHYGALPGRELSHAEVESCVFQGHRVRDAAVGRGCAVWDSGSTNPVSPCGQDLRIRLSYIPSDFSAFSPCSCPLWVSPSGEVVS